MKYTIHDFVLCCYILLLAIMAIGAIVFPVACIMGFVGLVIWVGFKIFL